MRSCRGSGTADAGGGAPEGGDLSADRLLIAGQISDKLRDLCGHQTGDLVLLASAVSAGYFAVVVVGFPVSPMKTTSTRAGASVLLKSWCGRFKDSIYASPVL